MTEADIAARVKLYRHRAEELRAMVEEWRNPDTLAKLLALASDYDKMAEDLERGTWLDTGTAASE
jgi:hypothetical protein